MENFFESKKKLLSMYLWEKSGVWICVRMWVDINVCACVKNVFLQQTEGVIRFD